MNIPKNIIQFWHDKKNVPAIVKNAMKVTKKVNPEFNIVFVDDRLMFEWIYTHYGSKYLLLYQLNDIAASRADIARLMMLYEYGGFYLDAEMELSRSFSTLVDTDILLVQRDDARKYKNCPEKAHVINGIIGLSQKSELASWCLSRIEKNLITGCYNQSVWHATGPGRAIALKIA